MGRRSVGKESNAISQATRKRVASRVADWMALARAHEVLSAESRRAAHEYRVTPRTDPRSKALRVVADDIKGLLDVLVVVLDASSSVDRVRSEWTRWWIGRRRTLLIAWMKDYKRAGQDYPPSPEHIAQLETLLAWPPVDASALLEWSPPAVDARTVIARLNDPVVSSALSTEGPAKGTDELLARLVKRSSRWLRDLGKTLGRPRVRRPRSPIHDE